MTRKGIVEEIFSRAIFADDPNTYKIFYRNFEKTVEKTLPEFLSRSEGLQTIPVNRIRKITRNNTILFEKLF